MLFNPELLERVREETKGSFPDGNRPDMKYLEENCPQLNGIWNETLRLASYSSSVCYASQDTHIGDKIIRKGNRVMIPNRQLHFNEQTFGKNVHNFDPERFVNNEGILKNSSWRPFGGGATICPGRFKAKQAVLCYVAMVLQRFDIEVAGPRRFPTMEEGNPVLGIMSNKDGDDILVRLTPRKEVA
jgi:cytochrome P450